jgi:hypothetical protein
MSHADYLNQPPERDIRHKPYIMKNKITFGNDDQVLKIKLIPLLLTIGMFAIPFFYLKSCFNDDKKESKKPTKIDALIKSETFVEQKLKAPSTAKFGWDAVDRVKQINDSTFEINNYVDSQNSFGAMLRQNYSCTIIFDGEEVKCKDLQFSE